MELAWVNRDFPAARGMHRKTSEKDEYNNCIAYAAGVTDEWWQDTPGYRWPASIRSPRTHSLVAVFQSLGFAKVDTDAVEPGYEKVAIYELNGMWTHAAKQLPSGKWKSKLGPDEDIEHDNPECLCGQYYGVVHCIMRKSNEQEEAGKAPSPR